LINATEAELEAITFEDTLIDPTTTPAAILIGIEDPTGNPKARHAYRAEVTSLLSGGGNGDYTVSVSHGKKDTFGASLVIVYEDANIENGTVIINDGMAMLSKKKASTILTGASVTSTIDNLSLGNPPVGTMTVIVSEGTATDDSQLTFTGSSSDTYTDFTSNTDGKVWDDRTIDVSDLLSSDTTSVTTTLTDNDDKGAYVHYFVNIFKTQRELANLSETSMTIDKSTSNPDEALTLSVSIPNTGGEHATDSYFRIYLDENAAYVPNSSIINGVSKLDSDPAVIFNSGPKELALTIGTINYGTTATLSFQIKMLSTLNHGEEFSKSGTIVATGWGHSQTDGDGNIYDGIDRPTTSSIQGGVITGLPASYTSNIYLSPSVDPMDSRRTGNHSVVIRKDGVYIGRINLDLDDDISLAGFSGETSRNQYKAFAHWSSGLPGSTSSYNLIIPKQSNDSWVRICLGATSLSQIEEGCADTYENVTQELVLTSGVSQSGIVCTAMSNIYWECTGVTGSGGESGGDEGGEVPLLSNLAFLLTGCFVFYLLYKTRPQWQHA
jgi:uncharacterized repeat protein (TIGR01451 family)